MEEVLRSNRVWAQDGEDFLLDINWPQLHCPQESNFSNGYFTHKSNLKTTMMRLQFILFPLNLQTTIWLSIIKVLRMLHTIIISNFKTILEIFVKAHCSFICLLTWTLFSSMQFHDSLKTYFVKLLKIQFSIIPLWS